MKLLAYVILAFSLSRVSVSAPLSDQDNTHLIRRNGNSRVHIVTRADGGKKRKLGKGYLSGVDVGPSKKDTNIWLQPSDDQYRLAYRILECLTKTRTGMTFLYYGWGKTSNHGPGWLKRRGPDEKNDTRLSKEANYMKQMSKGLGSSLEIQRTYDGGRNLWVLVRGLSLLQHWKEEYERDANFGDGKNRFGYAPSVCQTQLGTYIFEVAKGLVKLYNQGKPIPQELPISSVLFPSNRQFDGKGFTFVDIDPKNVKKGLRLPDKDDDKVGYFQEELKKQLKSAKQSKELNEARDKFCQGQEPKPKPVKIR